jgi:serine/threonine protein phosphatase PrpC
MPGDRVLLATDGVTDNFFDETLCLEELAQLASTGSLTQAAELIVDQCQQRMRLGNLPDGRRAKCDNLSLAMLEFRG